MKVVVVLSMIIVVLATVDEQTRWEYRVTKSRSGIVVKSGYYFSKVTATGTAAEDYCVKYLGGHLTSIQSKDENTFINEQMKIRKLINAWIGFNDLNKEKTFEWSNKDPITFLKWAKYEPNNLGNEDCTHMRYNGEWNDEKCKTEYHYICKV